MPLKKKNKRAKNSSVCLLRPHKARGSPSSSPPSSTSPNSFPPHPSPCLPTLALSRSFLSVFLPQDLGTCLLFCLCHGLLEKEVISQLCSLGCKVFSERNSAPSLVPAGFQFSFLSQPATTLFSPQRCSLHGSKILLLLLTL